LATKSSSVDEIANMNFLTTTARSTKYHRLAHKLCHRSTLFIGTGSQASKQREQR